MKIKSVDGLPLPKERVGSGNIECDIRQSSRLKWERKDVWRESTIFALDEMQ